MMDLRLAHGPAIIAIAVVMALLAAPLHAHESPPITASAFSPDGSLLAVGSQSGIQLYRWPELTVQRQIQTRLEHVHHLTWTREHGLVAAGGTPGELGSMEAFVPDTFQPIQYHDRHDDLIYQMSRSPDGQRLATASFDRSIRVMAKQNQQLRGHSRPVVTVAFLPDNRHLLSGSLDHSLRLWDLKTGAVVRALTNHTAPVKDLAVRPHTAGRTTMVASAGADRTVRIWQPLIGRMVRFVRLPAEPLCLQWTPDGTRLIVGCTDGHVRVIDPESVELLADRPAINGWVYTISVAPDGQSLFAAGSHHQMKSFLISSQGDLQPLGNPR